MLSYARYTYWYVSYTHQRIDIRKNTQHRRQHQRREYVSTGQISQQGSTPCTPLLLVCVHRRIGFTRIRLLLQHTKALTAGMTGDLLRYSRTYTWYSFYYQYIAGRVRVRTTRYKVDIEYTSRYCTEQTRTNTKNPRNTCSTCVAVDSWPSRTQSSIRSPTPFAHSR